MTNMTRFIASAAQTVIANKIHIVIASAAQTVIASEAQIVIASATQTVIASEARQSMPPGLPRFARNDKHGVARS